MCFESQYFCDGSILRRRLLCAVLPSLSARMCLLLSLFRVRREILAPAVTLHSTLTVNCMEFARSEVQWPRTSLGLSTLFRPPNTPFPHPNAIPKPFLTSFKLKNLQICEAKLWMKVDPVFQLVVLGVLAKIERVAVARAILHLAPLQLL